MRARRGLGEPECAALAAARANIVLPYYYCTVPLYTTGTVLTTFLLDCDDGRCDDKGLGRVPMPGCTNGALGPFRAIRTPLERSSRAAECKMESVLWGR